MAEVTVVEEVQRYGKKIRARAGSLASLIMPASTMTASQEFEDKTIRESLSKEGKDESDDEWIEVDGVKSLEAPKEDHEESKRLATANGPIYTVAGRIKNKAAELAAGAAITTADYLNNTAHSAAQALGNSTRSEQVDKLVNQAANTLPVLKDLKSSYDKGKQEFARRGERNKLQYLTRSRSPDPRITDPRDAPEGSNLDGIAMIGTLENTRPGRFVPPDGGFEDVALE